MSLASGLLSDFMKTTRIPPPHSFLLGCLVGWGSRSGGYVIFKSPQHNTRANKHQTCYCKPESRNCQEGPGPQALETALLVVWPGRAFSPSCGSSARPPLELLGVGKPVPGRPQL